MGSGRGLTAATQTAAVTMPAAAHALMTEPRWWRRWWWCRPPRPGKTEIALAAMAVHHRIRRYGAGSRQQAVEKAGDPASRPVWVAVRQQPHQALRSPLMFPRESAPCHQRSPPPPPPPPPLLLLPPPPPPPPLPLRPAGQASPAPAGEGCRFDLRACSHPCSDPHACSHPRSDPRACSHPLLPASAGVDSRHLRRCC